MVDTVIKRRGTSMQPTNRFERVRIDLDSIQNLSDEENPLRVLKTEVYQDVSRSVITENDSPDIAFRYSLNPYRGCEHGCVYCYARPTHETLGWSAGLDFERKIMAKTDAPKLLREFLRRPRYACEPIVLSGVTDPYQPTERRLKITRACLEVMIESGQPVEIVTKSRLLLRDLDLLRVLAVRQLVQVSLAITTLDERLQHALEPRASSPIGRLEMMKQLTAVGIPVRLLIAPLIPGLTDIEIPNILKTARLCGAHSASFVMLRLPYAVKDIFFDWLDRHFPEKRARVESRLREVRGGRLNDPRFGERMRGTGLLADEIAKVFRLFARKHGFDGPRKPLDCSQFQAPADPSGQLTLF